MKKIFNTTRLLIIFILFFARIINLDSQTYRQQFDWINQNEFSGNVPSLISNLGTDFAGKAAPLMESYVLMYKSTKDIKYLNQLIIMSKRIMDRRDDNLDNSWTQVAGMPFTDSEGYEWHYNTAVCTLNDPPSTSQINCIDPDPSRKGWARLNSGGLVFSHFMESGLIVTPMARFFLLLEEEPSLKALPVPEEALSSSPNYLGLIL